MRCLTALARDDRGGLLGGGAIAIDAKNLRALARERHRGRLAIAPARSDRAGADHNRCLAVQASQGRLSSMSSKQWPGAGSRSTRRTGNEGVGRTALARNGFLA